MSGSAETVKSGRPSRAFAWLVTVLRFSLVLLLVVAAFASWKYLPGVSSLPSSSVRSLLPANTEAERAEAQADRLFGSALLPRTAVVQRAPGRLSAGEQRHIVRIAAALDESRLTGFPRGSRALPYLDTGGLLPGSRERSTTAITYLGFSGAPTPQGQKRLADRYAAAVSLPDAPARATGFIPGSVAQSNLVDSDLIWVEIASVLAIAVILGIYLRSVLAPLVTLAAAGITYLISIGVVAYLAHLEGLQLENELKPIIVVLLLGVVTDYSVFFMSDMRARIVAGEAPRDAATRATAQVVPIVFTAGLVVAAGLVTLRLASIGFVQGLGPAMAIAVLVGLAISITFVPASMRILGRSLFWPGLPRPDAEVPRRALVGAALREWTAWSSSHRLLAVPTVLVVIAGLGVAAWSTGSMKLALTPIRGLPADASPSRADTDAARGFTPGIVAPSEIVVEAPGIASRRQQLGRFGRELSSRPEVGAVIGAGMVELPHRLATAFRSHSGGAVRYFVAFRDHPYSSAGVADLGRLQGAMPGLLATAGLSGSTVLYAGDTALAQETIARVYGDLLRVGIAAALVNLALLALFLRSIVAPIALVASSALAIVATFGVTTLLFSTSDLTYYVPLAVGVLLLSFGTDYNLFVVGRIWQESKDRNVSDAVRAAVPRASHAISIAGIALAASFATLAIVPIAPFREFAVAIAIGVIIDTFIVRTLLIPAVFTTLGSRSWWPSRRGTVAGDGRAATSHPSPRPQPRRRETPAA